MDETHKPNFVVSLLAGAAAGTTVDMTLFPLDTIKTRLQSKQGFYKSGGFRAVYKGIIPALVGSAPSAAIFFMTYNSLLNYFGSDKVWRSVNHMTAAGLAEVVTASVRVPIEIVKQRKQTAINKISSFELMRLILKHEGVKGFYRGFTSTIAREVPFGTIQFPIWESLKIMADAQNSFEIGLCGAVAGGIAASLTTPMDVLKTRTMLADFNLVSRHTTFFSLYSFIIRDIFREHGLMGFFAGIIPRVIWITIGGFIYFGTYGKAVSLCENYRLLANETRHRL